jgi:RNA polymerase sigma factor (sigma-70 family)
MSTKFYVKDVNGTIPSSNGQAMFKLVQGKEVADFVMRKEYKEREFFTYKNEYGDSFVIECTKEEIKKLRKEKNHTQYVKRKKKENGVLEISLNTLISTDEKELEMTDVLIDENSNTEEYIEKKEEYENLHNALELLDKDERELIYLLFFAEKPLTERQLAEKLNVSQSAINQKKIKILKKIKKFL